jgi:hypothetical protein
LDVAPTVLALFGCNVPKEMDGRILEEYLTPPMREVALKVQRIKTDALREQESKEGEDVEAMRRMLKSLGYM